VGVGTERGGSPDGHSTTPSPAGRRPLVSASAVVLVFGAAGLLFATSAETARGTQLRADRTDLAGLIRSENAKHDAKVHRLDALNSQIDRLTAAEAAVNGEVAALRARSATLSPTAGLSAVAGPGLVVSLNDAPTSGARPAGAMPDDLVVHQQDVQGVVNALWAGGAEAMMLMDQRVIATSAVRCVGNTLILQGRVYSPPFTLAAIGDPTRLQAAMDASPTIPIYLEYVQRYGLGWHVEQRSTLAMPAYNGTTTLRFARVSPAQGAPASSAPVSSAPVSSASAPSVSPSAASSTGR
jgi:uncharacterized protein YlxW (UPF0749 family)